MENARKCILSLQINLDEGLYTGSVRFIVPQNSDLELSSNGNTIDEIKIDGASSSYISCARDSIKSLKSRVKSIHDDIMIDAIESVRGTKPDIVLPLRKHDRNSEIVVSFHSSRSNPSLLIRRTDDVFFVTLQSSISIRPFFPFDFHMPESYFQVHVTVVSNTLPNIPLPVAFFPGVDLSPVVADKAFSWMFESSKHLQPSNVGFVICNATSLYENISPSFMRSSTNPTSHAYSVGQSSLSESIIVDANDRNLSQSMLQWMSDWLLYPFPLQSYYSLIESSNEKFPSSPLHALGIENHILWKYNDPLISMHRRNVMFLNGISVIPRDFSSDKLMLDVEGTGIYVQAYSIARCFLFSTFSIVDFVSEIALSGLASYLALCFYRALRGDDEFQFIIYRSSIILAEVEKSDPTLSRWSLSKGKLSNPFSISDSVSPVVRTYLLLKVRSMFHDLACRFGDPLFQSAIRFLMKSTNSLFDVNEISSLISKVKEAQSSSGVLSTVLIGEDTEEIFNTFSESFTTQRILADVLVNMFSSPSNNFYFGRIAASCLLLSRSPLDLKPLHGFSNRWFSCRRFPELVVKVDHKLSSGKLEVEFSERKLLPDSQSVIGDFKLHVSEKSLEGQVDTYAHVVALTGNRVTSNIPIHLRSKRKPGDQLPSQDSKRKFGESSLLQSQFHLPTISVSDIGSVWVTLDPEDSFLVQASLVAPSNMIAAQLFYSDSFNGQLKALKSFSSLFPTHNELPVPALLCAIVSGDIANCINAEGLSFTNAAQRNHRLREAAVSSLSSWSQLALRNASEDSFRHGLLGISYLLLALNSFNKSHKVTAGVYPSTTENGVMEIVNLLTDSPAMNIKTIGDISVFLSLVDALADCSICDSRVSSLMIYALSKLLMSFRLSVDVEVTKTMCLARILSALSRSTIVFTKDVSILSSLKSNIVKFVHSALRSSLASIISHDSPKHSHVSSGLDTINHSDKLLQYIIPALSLVESCIQFCSLGVPKDSITPFLEYCVQKSSNTSVQRISVICLSSLVALCADFKSKTWVNSCVYLLEVIIFDSHGELFPGLLYKRNIIVWFLNTILHQYQTPSNPGMVSRDQYVLVMSALEYIKVAKSQDTRESTAWTVADCLADAGIEFIVSADDDLPLIRTCSKLPRYSSSEFDFPNVYSTELLPLEIKALVKEFESALLSNSIPQMEVSNSVEVSDIQLLFSNFSTELAEFRRLSHRLWRNEIKSDHMLQLARELKEKASITFEM
jgi:hypothetical protein